MEAGPALQFAYDWPKLPFLPLICCTCNRLVGRGRALAHMNERHPGWLEAWNQTLADNGVI